MTDARPAAAPPSFHVLAKPTGAICNLDCSYCFFLTKEALYPGDRFRMNDEVLRAYIGQLLDAHTAPEVTIAWQGGEPTLMGVDFFRRAVALAEELKRPGVRLEHTIQTNGTLLNDEWCTFLADHHFLVGLSLDGPRELHDAYRVDKKGRPTFDRVMAGLDVLRRHDVDVNILCTVNAANAGHPLEVYRFFRDECDVRYIQLIPIVERDNDTGFQEGDTVTDRSVAPGDWGRFLVGVFDEWVAHDVGRVFVVNFDAALGKWLGVPGGMCIFDETCGRAVALEHNGDVYSCDHFVEPGYLLGNVMKSTLVELIAKPEQRRFGDAKRDTLPRYCRECPVLFACHGECPKNRFATTPDGEPGLNYLCEGYKAFFTHVDHPMRTMAGLLRQGRYADEAMAVLAAEADEAYRRAGRNDPCPCGSGRKHKLCHGAA
ncbi:MAG TPA: anaerobic sulfatase maturase [Acidimicrobiales bacterium]|nr:anaerobic sulfatase maturase [Acidimicrobiales bacterium]